MSNYGNGGFRFAEVSHKGSLLFLPSGIYAWDITDFSSLEAQSFELIFPETAKIEFLLLGSGPQLLMPNKAIREVFESHDIGLETMSTGAAVRTYNVLLAENRSIAAALIAVDNP